MIREITNFIDKKKAHWSYFGDYFFIASEEAKKISLESLNAFNGINYKYTIEGDLLIQEATQ